MQIDCPDCSRSYEVSSAALGVGGRMVVCPSCGARWYAAPIDDDRHPIAVPAFVAIRADMARDRPSRGIRPRIVPRRASGVSRPLAIGLTCVGLLMLGIGKRAAIVTAVPRTAALYAAIGLPVNIRGLAFADLKTVRLDEDAPRVEISGRIRNLAEARTPVPRLTFDIRDAQGTTLASWTEGAPKRLLGKTESVAFTTLTPELPEGTRDVVVRFDASPERDTLLIHPKR